MTSKCPDLFSISDAEIDTHLSTCPTCAALWAMHDISTEEFSPECETVELLIAARMDGPLTDSDTTQMNQHISTCSRCLALTTEVALVTKPLHPKHSALGHEDAWQGATDAPDELAQRRARTSKVLLATAALVAAAAALFFITRTKEEPAPSVATAAATPDSPPLVPSFDPKHPVGAARPATENNSQATAPVVYPGKTVEELLSESRAAITSKDYAKGYSLCSSALQKDPMHQGASMNCAVAACNLKQTADAQRHIDALQSSSRRAAAKQICIRLGTLVEDHASLGEPGCDEITCLVEPSKPCCQKAAAKQALPEESQATKPPAQNSCDEITCLVEPNSPCCKKRRASPLPEKLSRKDITKGINQVKEKIMACKEEGEGELSASITISPSGKITRLKVTGGSSKALRRCVRLGLKPATFAKTKKGMSVQYPIVFR